jgi:hypothetical protein
LYNGLLPFQGAEIGAHYYPGRCPELIDESPSGFAALIDKRLSGFAAQVIRMETLSGRSALKLSFIHQVLRLIRNPIPPEIE